MSMAALEWPWESMSTSPSGSRRTECRQLRHSRLVVGQTWQCWVGPIRQGPFTDLFRDAVYYIEVSFCLTAIRQDDLERNGNHRQSANRVAQWMARPKRLSRRCTWRSSTVRTCLHFHLEGLILLIDKKLDLNCPIRGLLWGSQRMYIGHLLQHSFYVFRPFFLSCINSQP